MKECTQYQKQKKRKAGSFLVVQWFRLMLSLPQAMRCGHTHTKRMVEMFYALLGHKILSFLSLVSFLISLNSYYSRSLELGIQ